MKRILVVDDDEQNRGLLHALLLPAGYRVDHAADGARALELARANTPNLVISDLQMPVMDGYTLLRHWKADENLQTIPFVVYSSSYNLPADEELALNMGADAFVVKPAEPDTLLELIRHFVEAGAPRARIGQSGESAQIAQFQQYGMTLGRKLAERSSKLEISQESERTVRREKQEILELQAAIFDSLPAKIALIDADGLIVSVNRAWRQHALHEASPSVGFAIGQRYLDTSGGFLGASRDGAAAALGVHQVLQGEIPTYTEDYEAGERWYRLTASPLGQDHRLGAIVVHADITEGVLATQALQKAERNQRRLAERLEVQRAHLAQAQELLKVGTWELDLLEDTLIWSEQTHKFFGTNSSSYKPSFESFLSRVHPEDWEMVKTAYTDSISRHQPYAIDHRLLLEDGSVRVIHERCETIYDSSGVAIRSIGTTQDVTEQREAERRLRQSEERFHLLANNIHEVFWISDIRGRRVLYVSPAYEKIWGRSCESLYAAPESWIEAIHPDDRQRVLASILDQGQRPQEQTYRILRPDGEIRWIQERSFPVYGESAELHRIVGTSQDYTERKLTEERLGESQALLKIGGRIARLGGWSVDFPERRLVWSEETYRIHELALDASLSVDEALGFYTLECQHVISEAFTACAEKFIPFDLELEIITATERKISVRSIGEAVRNSDGTLRRVQGALQDITERKKLESQFLRAQRMESIGTLAGGIAHDLNNVLSPIMLAIELLKLDEIDEEKLDIIKSIESSARRGSEMVRQVLSFGRGVEGERQSVRIKELVSDVERIVKDTFPKNIIFTSKVPADVWNIVGDPTQLHQVLINLVVNARDAMPGGGTISISAGNESFDETYASLSAEVKPGPYVWIQVEDTGSGIPAELLGKIFDPFFTTKEIGKGTGLGLSTSLAIVKSHGGSLRVYSEPNRGSRFRIYFVAEASSRKVAAPAPPTLPRGNGELILVVDDEASVRDITRQTLEAFGYRVVLAVDGAQGVAVYAEQKQNISIVLTDMMMPVMDGATMIQVLTHMDPNVRIIAASGLGYNGTVASAANPKVKHFLPKPYTAVLLLTTLHRLLEERPTDERGFHGIP